MKKHEADKLIDAIRSLLDPDLAPAPSRRQDGLDRPHQRMNKEQLEETARIAEAAAAGKQLEVGKAVTMEGTDQAGGVALVFPDKTVEGLYQAFKARLLEELPVDPVFIHVLAARPEILVDVEKRVVELDGSNDLKGRIAVLIANGFLAQPRKGAHINNELERTGTKAAGNRLSDALAWLKKAGFIVEAEGGGYQAAAGVKVTERTIESRG